LYIAITSLLRDSLGDAIIVRVERCLLFSLIRKRADQLAMEDEQFVPDLCQKLTDKVK
jgi:DNA-directed RNA polymerase subunit K/omega